MKKLFLSLIRFYQKTSFVRKPILRSLLQADAVCRFSPTCSDYSYQAIQKHGVFKGSWLTFKRMLRCQPWGKGGYDPVP